MASAHLPHEGCNSSVHVETNQHRQKELGGYLLHRPNWLPVGAALGRLRPRPSSPNSGSTLATPPRALQPWNCLGAEPHWGTRGRTCSRTFQSWERTWMSRWKWKAQPDKGLDAILFSLKCVCFLFGERKWNIWIYVVDVSVVYAEPPSSNRRKGDFKINCKSLKRPVWVFS